jgi:hypothetical protein
MSKDSVVVFMDYQNVHNSARRQFLDYGADHATGHVDPLRVAQLLCQRRSRESELKQVRVYRGRPNPERQPGAARANDRQTSVWQRSPLVHVVRRNLDYPYSWPDEPATEKGIDVAISSSSPRTRIYSQPSRLFARWSCATSRSLRGRRLTGFGMQALSCPGAIRFRKSSSRPCAITPTTRPQRRRPASRPR